MLGEGLGMNECACKLCICKPSEPLRPPSASKHCERLENSVTSRPRVGIQKQKVHVCINCAEESTREKGSSKINHALHRELSKAGFEKRLIEIKREREQISNSTKKEISDKLHKMALSEENLLFLKLINFGSLPKVIRSADIGEHGKKQIQKQTTLRKVGRKQFFRFKQIGKEFIFDKKKTSELNEGERRETSPSSYTYFVCGPFPPTVNNKQAYTGLNPLNQKKGPVTAFTRDQLKRKNRKKIPNSSKTNDKLNSSKLFKSKNEKYVTVRGQDRTMETSVESLSYATPRSNVKLSSEFIQINVEEGHYVTSNQDVTKQTNEESTSFHFFKTESEAGKLAASAQDLKERNSVQGLLHSSTNNNLRKQRISGNIIHPTITNEIQSSNEVVTTKTEEGHLAASNQNRPEPTIQRRISYSSMSRDKRTFSESISQEPKVVREASLRNYEGKERKVAATRVQDIKNRNRGRSLSYLPTSNKRPKRRDLRNITQPLITTEIQTSNEVISTNGKEVILGVSAQDKIEPKPIEKQQNNKSENSSKRNLIMKINEQSRESNVATNYHNLTKQNVEKGHDVTITHHLTKGTKERSLSSETSYVGNKLSTDFIQIHNVEGNDITSKDPAIRNSVQNMPHLQRCSDTETSNAFFLTKHKDKMFPANTQDHTQQTSAAHLPENSDASEDSIFFSLICSSILSCSEFMGSGEECEETSEQSMIYPISTSTEFITTDHMKFPQKVPDECIRLNREENPNIICIQKLKKETNDDNIPNASKTKETQTSQFTATEKKEVTLEAISQDQIKRIGKRNTLYPITKQCEDRSNIINKVYHTEQNSELIEPQTLKTDKTRTNVVKCSNRTQVSGLHRSSMRNQLNHERNITYPTLTRAEPPSMEKVHYITPKEELPNQISEHSLPYQLAPSEQNLQIKIAQEHLKTTTLNKTSERNRTNQPTSVKLLSIEPTISEFKEVILEGSDRNQMERKSIEKLPCPPQVGVRQGSREHIQVKDEGIEITTTQNLTKQIIEGNATYPPRNRSKLYSNELVEINLEEGNDLTNIQVIINPSNMIIKSHPLKQNNETRTSDEFTLSKNKETNPAKSIQNLNEGNIEKIRSTQPMNDQLPSAELIHNKLEEGHCLTTSRDVSKEIEEGRKSFSTAGAKLSQTEVTPLKLKERHLIPTAEIIATQTNKEIISYPKPTRGNQSSTEIIEGKSEEELMKVSCSPTSTKKLPYTSSHNQVKRGEGSVSRSSQALSKERSDEDVSYQHTSSNELSYTPLDQITTEETGASLSTQDYTNVFNKEKPTSIDKLASHNQVKNSENDLARSTQVFSKEINVKKVFGFPICNGELPYTAHNHLVREESDVSTLSKDFCEESSKNIIFDQITPSSTLPCTSFNQVKIKETDMARSTTIHIEETSEKRISDQLTSISKLGYTSFNQIQTGERGVSLAAQDYTKASIKQKVCYSPISSGKRDYGTIDQVKREEGGVARSTIHLSKVGNEKKIFDRHTSSTKLPCMLINQVQSGRESVARSIIDLSEESSKNKIIDQVPYIPLNQVKREESGVARSTQDYAKSSGKDEVSYQPTSSGKLPNTSLNEVKSEERDVSLSTQDYTKAPTKEKVSYSTISSAKLLNTSLDKVESGERDVSLTTQDYTKASNKEPVSYLPASNNKVPHTSLNELKSRESEVSLSTQDFIKASSKEKVSYSPTSSNKLPHTSLNEVRNEERDLSLSTKDYRKASSKEKVSYSPTSSDKLSNISLDKMKSGKRDVSTSTHGFVKLFDSPTSSGKLSFPAVNQVKNGGRVVARPSLNLAMGSNEEIYFDLLKSGSIISSKEIIKADYGERNVVPLIQDPLNDTSFGRRSVKLPGPSEQIKHKPKLSKSTNTQKGFNYPVRSSTKVPCPFREQLLKKKSKKSRRKKRVIARRNNNKCI